MNGGSPGDSRDEIRVAGRSAGEAAPGPAVNAAWQDLLPRWEVVLDLNRVQALTLPMPAGSEAAKVLVRWVRQGLVR